MIVGKLSNSKVGKVMSKLYIQGQTIGIVGGGHLARMLTLTAHKLGLKVAILDPSNTVKRPLLRTGIFKESIIMKYI